MAAKKRKSQARRKSSGAKTSSDSNIGSVLLTGIIIGLFIAFGIYVYTSGKYQTMGDGLGKLYSSIAKPEQPADQDIKQEVTQLKPHFDYYKILLKNERPIPRFDEPEPGHARKPEPVKEKEKAAAETRKPASVYMLQVGAFRERKDAEELKARLAFSGLVANIQRVKLPEKGVFHRVRLGPFKTINAMNRADKKLAQQGIKAARMQVSQ